MTSRPPERAELETLLDPLLDFAQGQLRKRGEFHPFGATIGDDGQMALAGADPGDGATSVDVIDLLVGAMRSQADAGTIRAAAICYDARLRPHGEPTTDAITISLEHRAGDRALVAMPYSKGRFSGWRFGELVALEPVPSRIFVGGG